MIKIILLLIIIAVIFAVGVIAYDSNRFVVREIEIKDDRVSGEHRLLFVSDVHCKQYGKDNIKLFKKLETIKADAALVTGDVITAKKNRSAEPAVLFLEKLNSLMPVYYSYGNHETRFASKKHYGDGMERYLKRLSEIGVKIRDNETFDLDGISVTAFTLPHKYYSKKKRRPLDPSVIEHLVGPVPSGYSILMAHDPEYFEGYVSYGSSLVLSGHFHGGIVRFGKQGLISPRFTLFPKYCYGMYKKNNTSMLVTSGLGAHTLPFRMFNPAEIIILNIKKS